MRDLKGDNKGVINDYSRTIIVKDGMICDGSKIEKEETTLGKIIKEKVIEAIVGVVLSGVAALISSYKSTELFNSLEESIKICLILVIVILFVVGIGLVLIFLYDIINLLILFRKGSFVELESKVLWLDKLFDIFRNSEDTASKDVRVTGKCYKNIEGKIYNIKGKKCPICETEPIGNMSLKYSNCLQTYFWECSQNQAHKIEFDYKKKI